MNGEIAMLKNYMEFVVEDILPIVLKEREIKCDCLICLDDISAITLNNLKPMYGVSEKGILYNKLNELNNQFKADVIREIMRAMQMVEKKPSHK